MKFLINTYNSVLFAICFSFAGCSDELNHIEYEELSSKDYVTFDASVSVASDNVTRSEKPVYNPLVLNSDSEEFPLYLHTWEHPLGENDVIVNEVGNVTRGIEIESSQQLYDIHKSFGVEAQYVHDGSTFISMQDTKLVTSGQYDFWTTLVPHGWLGNQMISFNAVAPYDHIDKLNNTEYKDNEITFNYSAIKGNGSNDAEEQIDLMLASTTINREGTKDYNYRVPLRFAHALSAVKFAIRDVLKGKVVSVAIKGVKSSATCSYKAEDYKTFGNFVWTNHTGSETYTQVFNYTIDKDGNFDPTDESNDIVLNNKMPEKTFMLIPQVIPDDAEIEVVIERENLVEGLSRQIKVKGKIKANNVTEWKPGHEYVYTLSTSKDNWVYVFDAEGNEAHGKDDIYVYAPSMDGFENYGNTAYFNVVSYRYKANDQNFKEKLPWKASHGGSLSYKVEGDKDKEYPELNSKQKWVESDEWITDKFSTPLKGNGSLTNEEHNLDFLPHYVSTDYMGDETMQGYEPYKGFTKENPYDLSTFGGKMSRTTANCYVVDRGGWYIFPLAYGNAIVNDADNKGAYTFSKSLTNFKDYKDDNITQPYIKNVTTSNKAQLVWQDAYNLVENIELVSINGELVIRFYMEPNSMQQGNAIIALTEPDGTIMWSWHIWATEHWLDKTTRLPHVYDTGNSSFSTFVKNYRTKMRERGDVPVTYNQKNRTFMMAPYNIGWCDPKSVLYLKRRDTMKFVQYMSDGLTPTSRIDELPIIQDGSIVDYKYANNTYFQWGRKDPIRGFFNHENSYKKVFGPLASEIKPQINISFKDAIQHPNIFYGKTGHPTIADKKKYQDWLMYNGYYNLWNNASSVNSESIDDNYDHDYLWCHKKTVYDPCPSGYMVPNAGIWHVIQKKWSADYTDVNGKVYNNTYTKDNKLYGDKNYKIPVSQKDKWAGGDWSKELFIKKINGAWISVYDYKVWAQGNEGIDEEALFFSSTGNRWWTDDWQLADGSWPKGGDNFGKNVSYAWSNHYVSSYNAYGMALGLDTDNEDTSDIVYYVGGQFIGRRAMARPVRPIREP